MTVPQSVVNGLVSVVADDVELLLEPSSSFVQPVTVRARRARESVEKIVLFMVSKTSCVTSFGGSANQVRPLNSNLPTNLHLYRKCFMLLRLVKTVGWDCLVRISSHLNGLHVHLDGFRIEW